MAARQAPRRDYLTGLNPEQRLAVETTEGPVLVLAGAGTGKTRVLTTRIAHILATGRAFPSQILAVTFTNKAAREMKQRVGVLVGEAIEGMPWLGTFHSIGVKLLRRHAELAGLKSGFTILDTDDVIRLIKQLIQAEGLDDKRWAPRTFAMMIDGWKNKGLGPRDPRGRRPLLRQRQGPPALPGLSGPPADAERLRLRRPSAATRSASSASTTTCSPNITASSSTSLSTSTRTPTPRNTCGCACWRSGRAKGWARPSGRDLPLEGEMAGGPEGVASEGTASTASRADDTTPPGRTSPGHPPLKGEGKATVNICCVGDDDQSIYGWRGAEVDNILRFDKDFPGATIIRLERNYRSTAHILGAASHLIAHNEGRFGKTLFTEQVAEDDGKVHVHAAWDSEEEARAVGEEIERPQRNGHKLNDMAILVRASFQMREFEDRFVTLGLNYRVIGGPRFYERLEIRDALAFFRVVAQGADDLAFERIVNVPKRGLGEATIARSTTPPARCASPCWRPRRTSPRATS